MYDNHCTIYFSINDYKTPPIFLRITVLDVYKKCGIRKSDTQIDLAKWWWKIISWCNWGNLYVIWYNYNTDLEISISFSLILWYSRISIFVQKIVFFVNSLYIWALITKSKSFPEKYDECICDAHSIFRVSLFLLLRN